MKEQALWLYQKLTAGRRKRLIRDLRVQGNVPVAILFYHRIADQHPNGWTMNCADFSRQLDWLQSNFDVVSLEEAQRRVRANFCDRPTVSITFDDGYQDNANYAIPELSRRNLPATYFVSTEFVRTGKPFPHDARLGLPLAPNTIDEIRNFRDQGIEIGGHTRTHCNMGEVTDRETVRDEILGGVEQLQRWLGSDIRYFAFPFGLSANMTQLAIDVISESNLLGFCSAYGAWNWPNSDGFHLRRIHADPGIERLKNWLTLDPRKLRDDTDLPFVDRRLSHTQPNSTANRAWAKSSQEMAAAVD